MANQAKLEQSLTAIVKEINSESEKNFTGRIDVIIKMNQGGIDHVSVNLNKNLYKSK